VAKSSSPDNDLAESEVTDPTECGRSPAHQLTPDEEYEERGELVEPALDRWTQPTCTQSEQ
jgi:hypothetical protein